MSKRCRVARSPADFTRGSAMVWRSLVSWTEGCRRS